MTVLYPDKKIILFDGVCKLCSAWAAFLIKYDKNRVFTLATVQSEEGQAILKHYGYPTDHFDTMILLDQGQLYDQSTAFLKVMKQLPFPWPILYAFHFIPNRLRNWMYDRVALNRYRLFGQHESCVLPDPEHQSRFLGGEP
jgi:predicted DCC family thiol-disulfide oxidoreductase YuxK